MAAVLGFFVHGEVTKIEEEVRTEFNKAFEVFRSRHGWEQQTLADLLAPVNMHLRRTKLAFDRWNTRNLYLEMKIIGESNRIVRDLLLKKGHLIPPELRLCASKLVEHYDAWLQKFERKRLSENPDLETEFIFVGPDGYPFPSECDVKFRKYYTRLWNKIYGDGADDPK